MTGISAIPHLSEIQPPDYVAKKPEPSNVDALDKSFSEHMKPKANELSTIDQKTITQQSKSKTNELSAIDQKKNKSADVNGTDLALKKVSREVEQQLYSILWGIIFSTAGVDGSTNDGVNALKMFAPELLSKMVEDGMGEEFGEIANSIYQDLKRKQMKQMEG